MKVGKLVQALASLSTEAINPRNRDSVDGICRSFSAQGVFVEDFFKTAQMCSGTYENNQRRMCNTIEEHYFVSTKIMAECISEGDIYPDREGDRQSLKAQTLLYLCALAGNYANTTELKRAFNTL